MVRDVYAELGVARVVNAATTYTALGGTVLPPEVVEAMASASTSCVDMHALQAAAGRHLAALTDNEAAMVTSGCAAAIVLAVLACITGGDPARIARIPDDQTLARNVVLHRAQRIPYDRAIEMGGGRIVEVGNVLQTFAWELDAAIDDRTACVFYVAGAHLPQTVLSLEETVAIAHAKGVPVIVDAAAQLPPVSNLWHFTKTVGADLVLFSGGKGLRGPQASGLLLGRADLVEAAQHNAAPWQRWARPMKVGKEEIAGLVAAVERYLALDHEAEVRAWWDVVEYWARELVHPDVTVSVLATNEAGQPVPRVALRYASAGVAETVQAGLLEHRPAVAVVREGATIFLSPDCLSEGHVDIVRDQVRAAHIRVGIEKE